MIFFRLIAMWRWLVRQVKLPNPGQLAHIDNQMKCPVCGFVGLHQIRCIVRVVSPPQRPAAFNPAINTGPIAVQRRVLCQHTCNICGARWFQEPLAKTVDPTKILSAIARTELEKKEDQEMLLQMQPQR